MNNHNLLKGLLVAQAAVLLLYTFWAFQNEGPNLLQVFISNMTSSTWNGQFNVDFTCYLVLSGLWIMWRKHFSLISVGLGLFAMVAGFLFFGPFFLFLLKKENGDLKKVLLGER